MLRKTSNKEDNYNNNNNENESSISATNTITSLNATLNETDHDSENIIYTLQNPRYAVLVLDMLNDFVYGKLKCEGAK